MSTPSSIVGEQYNNFQFATAEGFFAFSGCCSHLGGVFAGVHPASSGAVLR